MKRIAACLAFLCAGAAAAAEPVSFKGKTVTMLIGYAPGGGTDVSGRLIANYFGKYLPGNPSIVVENMPGADGLSAMNYFAQQVRPDGMTITMGADTQIDPGHYRIPLAHYDPRKFDFIGGAGRGATSLIIRQSAEPRLYDKSASPVVMGTIGGVPHSGMQATAWGIRFLGWNAKWVLGYSGTSELILALRRGEIEMTATANLFEVRDLLNDGTIKILAQTSMPATPRSTAGANGDAPAPFTTLMGGKIADPLQRKGFDYWRSLTETDKWLAAPPGSPADVVDAYRTAYRKMAEDPDFRAQTKSISPDFTPQSHQEFEKLVRTLADTPPEAIEFIDTMLRDQGLNPS